jgi:NAD(P)-dependent dehydrogenase (short-subunit alcohol dehydrogenase family)
MSSMVVLVTGASSGIGNAVAKELAKTGHRVFGTSRNIQTGTLKDSFEYVRMDVTNELQVKQGIEHILKVAGRLDVVVNNAGLGMVGPIENITDAEARMIFDTNVFGVLNVCRQSIPYLRLNRISFIINITSLAGQMGLPFRGIYSASKFAVEGFTESLSQEVSQFGIRVVIIEPGDFKTNINTTRKVADTVGQHYGSQNQDTLNQITREVANAPTPEAIGKKVAKIITSESPSLRYRVANLTQRFSLTLMRLLPGRLFEKIIMKYYKMK